MAQSKGSRGAEAERSPQSASGGTQRTGWQRWRPYSAAVIGVGALLVVSAVIGAHVRAGKVDEVKIPTGLPSTGPSDLAVPIKPAIPVVVTVYEDFRSPASKAFDATWQPTLDALLNSGKAEVAYRLVTPTDAADGGNGSLYAANAAGCAQNQGKDQFEKFTALLWKHQPPVSQDTFGQSGYLVRLGRKVHNLQASEFVPCVQSLDFQGWVRASQKDFVKAGLGSVPVLQVNGTTVADLAKLTPAKLTELVDRAAARAAAAAQPAAARTPAKEAATSTPTAAPSTPVAETP